jgi:hypothetical protein
VTVTQRTTRTARALRAIAIMDSHRLPVCANCEGLLLTAAAGRPLPLVRDADGAMFDMEQRVDRMIEAILQLGCAP